MVADRASPFEVSVDSTHPSDDARMRAVLRVLDRLGFDSEASEVEGRWRGILAAGPGVRDRTYSDVFADDLLDALADTVIAGCAALGLVEYDDRVHSDTSVLRLVNEAWHRVFSDPVAYAAWEEEILRDRWSAWGA
jgi:hypothetical protein